MKTQLQNKQDRIIGPQIHSLFLEPILGSAYRRVRRVHRRTCKLGMPIEMPSIAS